MTKSLQTFCRRSILIACCLGDFSLVANGQARPNGQDAAVPQIEVGKFVAEALQVYTTDSGLPDNDVCDILLTTDGNIYAGTAKGLARLDGGKWRSVTKSPEPIYALAQHADRLVAVTGRKVTSFDLAGNPASLSVRLPDAADDLKQLVTLAADDRGVVLGSAAGLFALKEKEGHFVEDAGFNKLAASGSAVRQIAIGPKGEWAVAAAGGLFFKSPGQSWQSLSPVDGKRSWAPRDVRGVAFDRDGRLWFASVQGAGRLDGDKWTLFTGDDGLPYDDFTTMAAGEAGTDGSGVVWFGTSMGGIRFDGTTWNYRRSRRWLPDDAVRAIAVQENGDAWFATAAGVGLLERKLITLAEKAAFFEDEIDKYHRRTPFGFVHTVRVGKPGEKVDVQQQDSDNDGLWTGMYGAGECFAYAARKDPKSKARG